MSLEGKIIGNRYEVLEKIGIGGMATVYKAKDNILKRNVAVKVLRDEFTTDEEFIKFLTEMNEVATKYMSKPVKWILTGIIWDMEKQSMKHISMF